MSSLKSSSRTVVQTRFLPEAISAGAVTITSSSKPALNSAPLQTRTSFQSATSMPTSVGVAITRYSPFLMSLSIPNFILIRLCTVSDG